MSSLASRAVLGGESCRPFGGDIAGGIPFLALAAAVLVCWLFLVASVPFQVRCVVPVVGILLLHVVHVDVRFSRSIPMQIPPFLLF